MMLHRMAFHLSGKVVALHLDNSMAKAYLCNQGGTVFSFSFQAGLPDTESDQQAWYYSYSSIHSYPPQCGGGLSVPGPDASRVASSSSGGSGSFSPLGPSRGGPADASSHSTQCQHYYTLESPLPLGTLGLNAFNHLWQFQVGYMFPPPALVPLILSKFLTEHVKGQLRQLIVVAPCWMEAPWLPTVLNMLADIPWQWYPIIKDLVMDVSVGQVLKGLPYLHLTLWLLRDVCYTDRGSLPQSVRW